MNDNEIIASLTSRDQNGLSELQSKYGAKLTGIARGILGNGQDAEECVNDAYLSVWNNVPPDKPQSLFAYVSKIVRNTALTKLRDGSAKKRRAEITVCIDELEDVLPSGDDVSQRIEAAELSALIKNFLRSCDEDERDIFILRYYGFMRVADIAKKYGFTQSRVKMSLKRYRDRLSEYLERNGYKV